MVLSRGRLGWTYRAETWMQFPGVIEIFDRSRLHLCNQAVLSVLPTDDNALATKIKHSSSEDR
jgi:hypothetical protein